jgi:hypothetical protein
MARIRGVPSAIRQIEIVEEITDNLRPWKYHRSRAQTSHEVKRRLSILHEYLPLVAELYDRKKNRAHAKKLNRTLVMLEGLLKSAPGALTWSLFNPIEDPMLTEDEGAPLVLPQSFGSTDEILKVCWQGYKRFVIELNQLREKCARAISPGLGFHPNYDNAKHAAAWFAQGIILDLSHREVTGTEDGAFRTISSLLYEAASGEKDIHLKRACDAVLEAQTCNLPLAPSGKETSSS